VLNVAPLGDPVPVDGSLPPSVAEGAEKRTLGLYIHVPFCQARCGYCDFNTYTAEELDGVSRASYPAQAMAEMEMAHTVMNQAGLVARPLSTVFFGGGTPTLLGPEPLVRMLARAHKLWGLADHAEVSVEANPDSVTAEDLQALAAGGVTRVSLGVQSAHPDVLSVLDRTHDPARVPGVVQAAKDAGLQVSLDLIYGSPGETLSMWEKTLEYALGLAPDHLSTYALIVEPGTAMARRIARGELAMPDDDVHADMYELTDRLLSLAGYGWYEISNWATSEALESRHNRSYWSSEDWWGIGPGAHSHIGGVRWWNVKHPAAYTQRLVAGQSPIHSREVLSGESKDMERILLGIRMREGIPARWVSADKKVVVADAIARGLLDGVAAISGTLVVTAKGRLVADFLARELT